MAIETWNQHIRHTLKHHCSTAPEGDDTTKEFYRRLCELVKRHAGQEAMRLPAARLPVLSHFYEVLSGALSGDAHLLQKDFTVAADASTERWRLVLTPVRPDDPALGQIASITLSGPDLADEVEIRKQAGDADHLHFLEQSVSIAALTAEESRLLNALGE